MNSSTVQLQQSILHDVASLFDNTITLLSIYDKAEQSTITQAEINRLLAELGINLSQS